LRSELENVGVRGSLRVFAKDLGSDDGKGWFLVRKNYDSVVRDRHVGIGGLFVKQESRRLGRRDQIFAFVGVPDVRVVHQIFVKP
jgi:hypothetical protein